MSYCTSCGNRVLVSKGAHWTGTRRDGTPFLLCRDCFRFYAEIYRGEK